MLIRHMDADGILRLRSDATNAYDLCLDVITVIEEDSRRYNQGEWAVIGTAAVRRKLESIRACIREQLRNLAEWGEPIPATMPNPDTFPGEPPACGTMACRAGWLVQLADGSMGDIEDIAPRAARLLGLEVDGSNDLQFYRAINVLFSGSAILGSEELLFPGTPEYAAEGVRGMKAFMAQWEARLRATPVPPPNQP